MIAELSKFFSRPASPQVHHTIFFGILGQVFVKISEVNSFGRIKYVAKVLKSSYLQKLRSHSEHSKTDMLYFETGNLFLLLQGEIRPINTQKNAFSVNYGPFWVIFATFSSTVSTKIKIGLPNFRCMFSGLSLTYTTIFAVL